MIYKEGYEAFLPNPEWEITKVIFTKVLNGINNDYELSYDLLSLDDIIVFSLTDIGRSIRINAKKDPVTVSYNHEIISDGLLIESPAEIFHLYWCHQLNLMAAIAAKRIKISGSLPKIMSLGQVVSGDRRLYINSFHEFQQK